MVNFNNYGRKLHFQSLKFLFCLCLALSANPLLKAQVNIVYPADAGVINVKNAPYNAKGDGTTDDTQAIQAALTAAGGHKIVYLPNGTYLVSNSLRWNNGNPADNGGWRAWLSLQGQSRAGTIIKLKDNTFTDVAAPKAVIITASGDCCGNYSDVNGEGNQAFENSVTHLTIDVGKGNPGAIGIDYQVSNWGALREVTIKSTDANKVGFCGVSLLRRDNGPGIIEKVSVDGFQYGIRVGQEIAQFTLENISLSNQSNVGIENREGVMAIRKLTSVNSVPAVRASAQSLTDLLEANLTGGSSANSAIEFVNAESRGYLRGITTSGYASAVKSRGTVVGGTSIGEWLSDPALRLDNSTQLSLNLPIEETPEYFDSNLSNWASAGAPSGTDDSDAIQAAMNSGKSTVYFQTGDYYYSRTIIIPSTVKHILGMGTVLRSTKDMGGESIFKFVQGSTGDPLLIERFEMNIRNGWFMDHNSSRTVVLKDLGNFEGNAYHNQPGSGKLFINNVAARGWRIENPTKVWARQLNPEGDATYVVNNGGDVWVLGFKVENSETLFETRSGGSTEAFAGLTYTFGDRGKPAIINNGSKVALSFAGTTYFQNGVYSVLARETSGSETKEMPMSSAYGGRTYSVPMYVGIAAPSTAQYRINSGGFQANPFSLDQYYSGNTGTYFTSDPIDVSGVTNPAPQSVYQSELDGLDSAGTFTYRIPYLTAGNTYKIRLHFVERYFTTSGSRKFNVSINGANVLSNFDIFAEAGAKNRAIVKEFNAVANASGQMVIAFTSVTDRALINGIEILGSNQGGGNSGTGIGLKGEYFDNMDLSGLKLTRTDVTINFNWGDGSPDPSIANDTYSVRWTGQIQPRYSETYTFYLNTDNGRRLWVNDQLIIDKWIDDWNVTYSGTIALQAGQKYNIKVEYFENWGGAGAVMEWASASQVREVVPKSQLYLPVASGSGLKAEYFNNKTVSGSPMLSRTDATVNMDLGDVSPVPGTVGINDFSIRWSGQVEAPVTGSYTFTTVSDDGVRLWINGVQVINNWTDHPATANNSNAITLNANQKYDIKMEYYEAGGLAVAKLLWSYPGQSQQIIPTAFLYPTTSTVARMNFENEDLTSLDENSLQTYPNPFSRNVNFTYTSGKSEKIKLNFLDGQGRNVKTVFEGEIEKGETRTFAVEGGNLKSGVYILRLISPTRDIRKKVMLIK